MNASGAVPILATMDTQPGPGVDSAASPTAPSFSDYEQAANAADLGSSASSTARADSSPAPSGDQSASTDASSVAASEPAPPAHQPRNLSTRKQQVDAEVAELKEQIRVAKALREELAYHRPQTDDKRADSSPAPAPTQADHVRYAQHPSAPQVDSFDSYEEYVAAMGVFIADQRYEDRQKTARLDAESRERVGSVTQTITGFTDKLAAARASDPAFDDTIDPGLFQLTPAFALAPGVAPRAANVLIQACVESDVSVPLLQHFSTPAGQQEWAGLAAARTPAAMLRAFGRIEARFTADGPTAAQAAKPYSSAPAPPTTLGSKPPQSPDRAAAAIKSGDFRAYQAAADAADLAVRRR